MIRTRRNRPGTRLADLWTWGPEDYANLTGPFAVQEYIQELIRHDSSNIEKIIERPRDVDDSVWQYEHMRQFIIELNLLVVYLQGSCTSISCPKMKATEEWMYLCASHKTPQDCSAIDYMTHNIDHATNILQNNKQFISRVSIPSTAIKNLVSIVRRLYRIFSHTYYVHRDIFLSFEKETHLCGRFSEFVRKYDMMPADLFNIPTHAFNVS